MNRSISMVTISREFGSGGGDIATRLGDRLRWRLVDRDVVRRVAERLGVPEQEVAERDEHVPGITERVGAYFAAAFPEMLLPPPPSPPVDHRTVRRLVEAALREAAESPPLVVVGHGAQCIFANRPDTLHVRVWAPLEVRVRRVAERLGLDVTAAHAHTLREDAARREYLRRNYDIDAGAERHYDVVLNTGRIGVEEAAAALAGLVGASRPVRGSRRGDGP